MQRPSPGRQSQCEGLTTKEGAIFPMDTQHPSAPPHAQSRPAANKHPNRRPHTGGGLSHDNTRHTARFTVIGNHLTQHPELSLLAIGLACHIQSLPKGARVDIKTLTARFPEGATRIAAALRELEAHGYLRRERIRVPGGRIVTRTVSCNQPGSRRHTDDKPARPAHPASAEKRAPRKKPLPVVPQPACPAPPFSSRPPTSSPTSAVTTPPAALHLRHRPPRPGVAAWLERDVTPTVVRHALTTDLPSEPLCRPAALLAHRLAAQLPPPPFAPRPATTVRHPLQNCDGCDRAFRSPTPGRCHDCRTPVAAAA
ncbi:helix-turn-helix domain-containing protein [Streptomyces sp. F001]|nr:helix-turn-helix domain-containing protein [Streptomyces sp. F001]